MFEITMCRPQNLDELYQDLAEYAGSYKLLAGGTDLVVEGRMGHHMGKAWIDVTRIPEFQGIEDRGDSVWVGSTATWTQIYEHPAIQEHFPAFIQCCFEVGSPQIRNLGTLGGNVANASPAGDSIPVLLIYDTEVFLRSSQGRRSLPVEKFLTGVRKTELSAGEVIEGFLLKKPHPEHTSCFLKLGPRESLAISKVNAAVKGRVEDGKFKDVAIAVGSAAPTVFRAHDAEASLEGRETTDEVIAEAAAKAKARSSTISDDRSTAEYRTAMVEVLARRGLEQVRDGSSSR